MKKKRNIVRLTFFWCFFIIFISYYWFFVLINQDFIKQFFIVENIDKSFFYSVFADDENEHENENEYENEHENEDEDRYESKSNRNNEEKDVHKEIESIKKVDVLIDNSIKTKENTDSKAIIKTITDNNVNTINSIKSSNTSTNKVSQKQITTKVIDKQTNTKINNTSNSNTNNLKTPICKIVYDTVTTASWNSVQQERTECIPSNSNVENSTNLDINDKLFIENKYNKLVSSINSKIFNNQGKLNAYTDFSNLLSEKIFYSKQYMIHVKDNKLLNTIQKKILMLSEFKKMIDNKVLIIK